MSMRDTPFFQVMKSEGYITPSLHILKHDLSNLAAPKGEIKSSFSWTSLFKSPTSSTLVFGEPTLGKLYQVKLLCIISSSTLWHPTLARSNQENELCITKHILFWTHLFILELHSLCQVLPLKHMDLIHHDGSNGEHSCVPFNLNNTSCGFMLKEVDWGGKHPMNSVVDWERHGPYPTEHTISEVDWGALHDSSFFLFLVNIDYDAKPKDFLTQQLWGGLPERTSSITLRSLNHIKGNGYIIWKFRRVQVIWITSWTHRGTPHLHYVHNMKVVTTYLTNGILGRNHCSLNSSGQLYQLRSFTSYGDNLNTISVAC